MHSIKKYSPLFVGFLGLSILFFGCSKKAYAAEKNVETKEVVKVHPYTGRLDSVLSKMNPRAADFCRLIKDNQVDFFSDLSVILEEEKTFRSDDKSLFFLIDKKHKAESSYVPKDLIELKANDLFNLNKKNMFIRPEAYEALKKMALASKNDGITLLVSSVYRSYQYQDNLFNYWVSVDGLEEAERESARPGTSQHQLATAIDFGSISDDFDNTEMGQWVYKNAADYGWSLSFPKGYEDVTGYRWECWHFRYVGVNACRFQKKWFGDVQQFMLEFIDEWNKSID
ncbi:M15 family metallopeptidase [Treponema sp.]|uniref:M15 family metallopeptidase n=1 Tax=Treponema sp. TaxID=166 RepID=UPI0038910617